MYGSSFTDIPRRYRRPATEGINMYIMVDVEADGPCPGLFSMISLGAVVVEPGLNRTFYAQFKPLSENWQQEALNVTKTTREETLLYEDPYTGMFRFNEWLKRLDTKPLFISDNNGFDWQFVNYYFWKFLNENPFGHSSTNLGSLYKGLVKNTRKNFKHLRKTKHTHNPVDDAKGNTEALLYMQERMGLLI
jgi:DNA polymerase III alpha subunit (gram-positive type)